MLWKESYISASSEECSFPVSHLSQYSSNDEECWNSQKNEQDFINRGSFGSGQIFGSIFAETKILC